MSRLAPATNPTRSRPSAWSPSRPRTSASATWPTAHFNVFNLTPSQVAFDMVSFGTSAMSDEQVAGQFVGDEAYAGARNFETLEDGDRARARPHLRLPDPQHAGRGEAASSPR